MDLYPLNLVLAVATASATIFLGFLPTKNVSSSFFAKETGKALLAWIIVAVTSPPKILHYPLILAFFCFAAWWHFRRDRAFTGKMWLSVASGLGISIGVMLILAVTPDSLPVHGGVFTIIGAPPDPAEQMSEQIDQTILLVSIYVGGAVIGLAYVVHALLETGSLTLTSSRQIIQRYATLLVALTFVRAAASLTTYYRDCGGPVIWAKGSGTHFFLNVIPLPNSISAEDVRIFDINLHLILVFFVLPTLAILSRRFILSGTRAFLLVLCLIGFLAEILARFEAL